MAKSFHTNTHRHLIDRFKNPSGDSSGYVSDDFSFSDEEIIRNWLDVRASLVSNYLDAGKKLSDQLVQTLSCVTVEEHDRSEFPSIVPSGCYWLRTVTEIPSYIKITSVTGIAANAEMPRYSPIRWDKMQYIPKDRMNHVRNGKFWTTRDSGTGRYIYLYGDRFIEQIAISGIWENPMEAAAFPTCGVVDKDALCNPLDVRIYTDQKLLDDIVKLTWAKLLPVKQSAPEDRKNNDNPKT